MSDRLSKAIQYEIDKINNHLPKKVISFRQVSTLSEPGVFTRDGHFNVFDDKELDRIRDIIPKQYEGNVILPIILTRRRDLGKGAYAVGGSKVNVYIIKQVLEDLPDYDIWRLDAGNNHIIYKYNLRKIRKEFGSTTVVAFA